MKNAELPIRRSCLIGYRSSVQPATRGTLKHGARAPDKARSAPNLKRLPTQTNGLLNGKTPPGCSCPPQPATPMLRR